MKPPIRNPLDCNRLAETVVQELKWKRVYRTKTIEFVSQYEEQRRAWRRRRRCRTTGDGGEGDGSREGAQRLDSRGFWDEE